jgi:hypothetical protein
MLEKEKKKKKKKKKKTREKESTHSDRGVCTSSSVAIAIGREIDRVNCLAIMPIDFQCLY